MGMPAQTVKDQQFLKDHGWRLMASSKYQYGALYYWDHDLHSLKSGRWWVQGTAVSFQKRFNKLTGRDNAESSR